LTTKKANKKKVTTNKASKTTGSAIKPLALGEPSAAETDAALASVQRDALALPAAQVQVVAIGAALALHNARIGVDNVLARKSVLSAQLRSFDASAVERVVTLGLAYGAASRRVDRSGTGEVARLYAILGPLRALTLTSAEGLALSKDLPAAEVARIRRGKGKIDGAQDGVDLPALFRKNWSGIRNKTSVTESDLAKLDETGRALLAILKPMAGRSEASEAVKAALDLRNRVGTLLAAAWGQLWSFGALAYGYDAIDEAVPSLQSVSGSGRKPAKPAATAAAAAT
jgi:hypothetical protein